MASCPARDNCLASCGPDSPCADCMDIACPEPDSEDDEAVDPNCPGGYIELNTYIPFIGKEICKSTSAEVTADGKTTLTNAFPKLMGGLMRIVMVTVMIVGFLGVLVWWFMIAAGGIRWDRVSKGKEYIVMVIAGLLLVGISGIVLNLINPSFFRTNSTGLMLPIFRAFFWL